MNFTEDIKKIKKLIDKFEYDYHIHCSQWLNEYYSKHNPLNFIFFQDFLTSSYHAENWNAEFFKTTINWILNLIYNNFSLSFFKKILNEKKLFFYCFETLPSYLIQKESSCHLTFLFKIGEKKQKISKNEIEFDFLNQQCEVTGPLFDEIDIRYKKKTGKYLPEQLKVCDFEQYLKPLLKEMIYEGIETFQIRVIPLFYYDRFEDSVNKKIMTFDT